MAQKKPNEVGYFSSSADRKILEDMLREVPIGEIITYDEMAKKIGRDVRKFCKGPLRGALKAIQKEKLFVFQAVPGIGYRNEDNNGKMEVVEGRRKREHRALKRRIQDLACVDYDALTREQRFRHDALATHAEMMLHMSTHTSVNKIEDKVKTDGKLAVGVTLKLFS